MFIYLSLSKQNRSKWIWEVWESKNLAATHPHASASVCAAASFLFGPSILQDHTWAHLVLVSTTLRSSVLLYPLPFLLFLYCILDMPFSNHLSFVTVIMHRMCSTGFWGSAHQWEWAYILKWVIFPALPTTSFSGGFLCLWTLLLKITLPILGMGPCPNSDSHSPHVGMLDLSY